MDMPVHFKGERESKRKDFLAVIKIRSCLLYNGVCRRRELGGFILFYIESLGYRNDTIRLG